MCLELNLAVEADSFDELKRKLHEMISSYFACVLDTNDKESIPDLLLRKAPLIDWINYYLIRFHLMKGAIWKYPICPERSEMI